MTKHILTLALSLFTFALLAVADDARAQSCTDDNQCTSGFCVDDVCCNSACTDPCRGCSAAVKGGGNDGECDLVPAGSVCEPSSCDPNTFSFVPADTCDAVGACIDGGPAESCAQNDGLCSWDLCHDTNGCEVVKATDGAECGTDLECFDGACVDASTGGAGGAVGSGGSGQGGAGAEGGSSGTGFGGVGTPLDGGGTDVNTACSCRAAGAPLHNGAASWLLLLAGLLMIGRRRRISPMLDDA